MLRIETPSAWTTMPFLRVSAPSRTTAVRSTPVMVRSCFAAGTTLPPAYVPLSSTIVSPGCAAAIASWSVGTSCGTWISATGCAGADAAQTRTSIGTAIARMPVVQRSRAYGSTAGSPNPEDVDDRIGPVAVLLRDVDPPRARVVGGASDPARAEGQAQPPGGVRPHRPRPLPSAAHREQVVRVVRPDLGHIGIGVRPLGGAVRVVAVVRAVRRPLSREAVVARALAVAERSGALGAEEQDAPAPGREDDVADHGRPVEEDAATWIPRVAPVPDRRMRRGVIDERCGRDRVRSAHVGRVEGEDRGAVRGAADDRQAAVPGQRPAAEQRAPRRRDLGHVTGDEARAEAADLIEPLRPAPGETRGRPHPVRHDLAPRGVVVDVGLAVEPAGVDQQADRKSTRLNSS